MTAKGGEPIVHVDVDTYSSRLQHSINVGGAVIFLAKAMTVSKCVHTNDQIEESDQIFSGLTARRSQVFHQLLVASNVKVQFFPEIGWQRRTGFLRRRLHQALGEVCTVSAFHGNSSPFQERNHSDDIHPRAAAEFQ